jgi:nitroimidazol reductase NimA-like FMN-containing flavoprotein (pyridoxamine 5'-phosphate oxidase superfamily)
LFRDLPPRDPEPEAVARAIIDAERYMTIATADAHGTPWASPVWYAHDGYWRLLWLSKPASRHSKNIEARRRVGIAIFDSSVPIGEGQGVYVSATATAIEAGSELPRAIEVYSDRSLSQGGDPWSLRDVTGDSRLRLYGATVTEAFILDAHDERVPVRL